MPLLLYSSAAGDEIGRAVLRCGKKDTFSSLSVEELILSCDWKRDCKGRFVCDKNLDILTFFDNADFIINRAFLCEDSFNVDFGISKSIVQTEIECMLREKISRCVNSTARPGLYGLCGDMLPLYMQWERIKTIDIKMATPRYDFAFGATPPDVESFTDVIYKSPHDLRSWRPNRAPDGWWHTFAVERPVGVPVIASVVRHAVLLSTKLDEAIEKRLIDCSRIICQAFGSLFGEILYFNQSGNITFAAFDHLVRTKANIDKLDFVVCQQLLDS